MVVLINIYSNKVINVNFPFTEKDCIAYHMNFKDFRVVPVHLIGKDVKWDSVLQEVVEDMAKVFSKAYDKVVSNLLNNYNNRLSSEVEISGYFFNLEDNFRIMIKSDIDTATSLGITQIYGLKDLRNNIVKCSIDEAKNIYKCLWIENKLCYVDYQKTLELINKISSNSSLDDVEKLVELNDINLDINVDPDLIKEVMEMDVEQLNEFIKTL